MYLDNIKTEKNAEIRNLLLKYHIQPYELAEQLGISQSTLLQKLEKELSKDEKQKVLKEICYLEVLKCDNDLNIYLCGELGLEYEQIVKLGKKKLNYITNEMLKSYLEYFNIHTSNLAEQLGISQSILQSKFEKELPNDEKEKILKEASYMAYKISKKEK